MKVGGLLWKAVALLVILGAVATQAETLNLATGDSVTLGGTTVTCNGAPQAPECSSFYGSVYCTSRPGEKCQTFYGSVYCGFNCGTFYGDVYCGATTWQRCQTFYGSVYCGQKCETLYGDVYCDGKKANPARPATPAKPQG